MKPLEHTSALGWVIALSTLGWVISGLMVILSLGNTSGPSTAALGAAGLCLSIMVTSVVGAIVLHGVKQMLNQVREPVMLPERTKSLQDRAQDSPGDSD